MSGILTHSPAQVLRELIIALNQGTDPDASLSWPVYADKKPDDPDNLIVVFNSTGRNEGRTMKDGEFQEKHGCRVVVRHTHPETGYTKARAIQQLFDQEVYQEVVTHNSVDYSIHSISRSEDIVNLGHEPGNRRLLFSFNCLINLRQI